MRLQHPLDDVFRSESHVRVLRALFHLPAGLPASAREVARRARIAHPTASRVLGSFNEQGLVTRVRRARADLYQLHMEHTVSERLADLFRWEDGIRGELTAFLRSEIRELASSRVTHAFLYGSAASGEMLPRSDIDVGVLHVPGKADQVAAAMEVVGEKVRSRFGNHLNAVLSDSSPEQLCKPRSKGHRLWRTILSGIPLIEPKGER